MPTDREGWRGPQPQARTRARTALDRGSRRSGARDLRWGRSNLDGPSVQAVVAEAASSPFDRRWVCQHEGAEDGVIVPPLFGTLTLCTTRGCKVRTIPIYCLSDFCVFSFRFPARIKVVHFFDDAVGGFIPP